jgi:hypothetical protein
VVVSKGPLATLAAKVKEEEILSPIGCFRYFLLINFHAAYKAFGRLIGFSL